MPWKVPAAQIAAAMTGAVTYTQVVRLEEKLAGVAAAMENTQRLRRD